MRTIVILASTAVLAAGGAWAQDAGAILAANAAASGAKASVGKGALHLDWAYAGQGMTGVADTTYDLTSGDYIDSAVTGPVKGGGGFDGREDWMRDMSGAITPQAGGDMRQLAVTEAYLDANLWWRPGWGGAAVTSQGVKSDAGHRYDVLSVTPKGGQPFEAWFDGDSHLLARTVEAQGPQTITTLFSDYRLVDGVQLAGKQVIDDGTGDQYRQTLTLTGAHFAAARGAAAYAAPKVVLTDARIDNAAGRTTVPFQLINNHVYAQVTIDGKGPFLCIFDTGGHDLLTPETARALAVKSEGEAPGTGAGEGVVDTAFARGVDFRVGDLKISDQTVSVLPFSNAAEGLDEQGMIGFEVFRRFVTQIDYGARTLTFIDPARFNAKDAGIPVPFVFYDHLPQVKGTFEGVAGLFDIDTGSRDEVTLTKPFVEASGLRARHPAGVTAVDGWGVGGRAISYVTKGDYLTLGPVRVEDVVAGFATQAKGAMADPSYQGNVGTALLKRFVVTFDYDHQIMYLKALPRPVPDSGTFDRSGMWINAAAGGITVVDVTAGGGADAAGLKVGDQITQVDGAPAASLGLSDLRQRLRDEPAGTKVALTVQTGGQTRTVTLTLKDQI